MKIREYKPADLPAILALFHDTVHAVNARDYTPVQLNAWAPDHPDLAEWKRRLESHRCLVAVENGEIAGFGDIDETGYLDHLFVAADRQGTGIGTALCDALEAGPVHTDASITARPFFEARGYRVVTEQKVLCGGVVMPNYHMEKL